MHQVIVGAGCGTWDRIQPPFGSLMGKHEHRVAWAVSSTLGFVPILPHCGLQGVVLSVPRLKATVLRTPQGKSVFS